MDDNYLHNWDTVGRQMWLFHKVLFLENTIISSLWNILDDVRPLNWEVWAAKRSLNNEQPSIQNP